MQTELLATSNVIELPKKASVAEQKLIVMGRSRKAALPLIIERLRHLYRAGSPAQHRMLVGGCPTDVPIVYARVGNLQVEFCPGMSPHGTYFCVFGHGMNVRFMTGYLYDGPVTPYHVMSWKRGEWQAELFD